MGSGCIKKSNNPIVTKVYKTYTSIMIDYDNVKVKTVFYTTR